MNPAQVEKQVRVREHIGVPLRTLSCGDGNNRIHHSQIQECSCSVLNFASFPTNTFELVLDVKEPEAGGTTEHHDDYLLSVINPREFRAGSMCSRLIRGARSRTSYGSFC